MLPPTAAPLSVANAAPTAPGSAVAAAPNGLPKRLGDRLTEAGLITPHQLELALREQRRTGEMIGRVLHKLGFATEQAIATFLAQDAQAPVVNVAAVDIAPATAALLPYELCRQAAILPLEHDSRRLVLAMADPFDVLTIDRVERLTGLATEVRHTPRPDLLERLASLHEREASLDRTIDELMRIGGQAAGPGDEEASAPMIRAVEQILAAAVRKGASDIHFEPDDRSLRIRMRQDGVLHAFLLVPKDLQDAFLARLKVMANLDVAETRLPQDGRFNFSLGRRELGIRVSCLPTAFGESVVLRILDNSGAMLDLKSLDLRGEDREALVAAAQRPHGVVLVTGPTGSGKTTTLYAALNAVNRLERSVFTLEDPIEYRLPHIRQTQVNEKIGLTFGAGLRTLLRQDPDVILVGETRDRDTAQLMVRAALTGHLVLSSLHTNDSFGAIPRLIDLGVEPFLLPATLHVVLAQRLVRRLCPACRAPVADPAAHWRSFGLPAEQAPETLWQARGCEACRQQGYRGRAAIFELLAIDDDYRKVLATGDAGQLATLARAKNMPLLLDDGLRRVRAGDTTLEEVFRVTCST
jgi:type IV pilus assembly protein PilB